MNTYQAVVTREGKWWMVAIPEIDGLTQARRLSDAEMMAREYIAVSLDVPVDDVSVEVSVKEVDGIAVGELVAAINDERARAQELEQDASRRAEELAKALAEARVPVRDIGAMMGVSHQRAHQLVNA